MKISILQEEKKEKPYKFDLSNVVDVKEQDWNSFSVSPKVQCDEKVMVNSTASRWFEVKIFKINMRGFYGNLDGNR